MAARIKWDNSPLFDSDTAFVAVEDNAIFPHDIVNFPVEGNVIVVAEDIVHGETAIFDVVHTALVAHIY